MILQQAVVELRLQMLRLHYETVSSQSLHSIVNRDLDMKSPDMNWDTKIQDMNQDMKIQDMNQDMNRDMNQDIDTHLDNNLILDIFYLKFWIVCFYVGTIRRWMGRFALNAVFYLGV